MSTKDCQSCARVQLEGRSYQSRARVATLSLQLVSRLSSSSVFDRSIRRVMHCNKRYARCLLCVLVVFAVLGYLFWPNVAHTVIYIYHLGDCNDTAARVYVDHLCTAYTGSHVEGSLCEPLCKTKEIRITKCLGDHRGKSYVFEAEWKGKPVIIKRFNRYSRHRERIDYFSNLRSMGYDPKQFPYIDKKAELISEQFIKQANVTLYHGIAGGRFNESTERVLREVVSECDLHGDGLLNHHELTHCWQIFESKEYMIALLLRGNPGVPEILGVCGELFVEDYAVPLDSDQYIGAESVLSSHRSWKLRAKLVIAILDLLEAIEDTPYGTLYYCDVKEANIGIVREGGRLVAKAIDLDSGWFGESVRWLKFQRNVVDRHCETDLDCDMLICYSACNTTSHTCTDRVTLNNFQRFCQTILGRGNNSWWRPHILQSPPTAAVQQELERIVQECANPSTVASDLPHHLPRDLIYQLRSLLLRTIQ